MIKMNEAGMRALQKQITEKITRADKAFRSSWQGKPVATIVPKVAGAYRGIGLELTSAQIREYAEAVSAGKPFKWVLK